MPDLTQSTISEELRPMADLHPEYTLVELQEAKDCLIRHFESAWQMFLRLERNGELNRLNLTGSVVNPTVKPQRSNSPNKPAKIT